MEKKESYRLALPHFQQPGQSYFVTWNLKDAIPPKALITHTKQLLSIRTEIEFAQKNKSDKNVIDELKFRYILTRKKYIKAYDDLLEIQTNYTINLAEPVLTQIIKNTLLYFEGSKIENYAFCIMPNHVHWVFRTFEKDTNGLPVYLEDIMKSIKRFSANKINESLGRKGSVWQAESFDTTIRDSEHLYNAIEYTLNNPVKANLIKNREDWPGNWWKEI